MRDRLTLHRNSLLKRVPRSFVTPTSSGFRFAGSTRDVIQRHVYIFGVWEPHITAFVTRHLGPGDAAIDVGANVGYDTCLMAAAVGPSGYVTALEPLSRSFDHLLRNLALNSFSWVDPVHAAAGAERGSIQLFEAPRDVVGSTTTARRRGFAPGETAQVLPLDEVVEPDIASRIRFVKIDVEGDEFSVIRGARSVLASAAPDCAVVMEVTPAMLAERGERSEDLFDAMAELGYHPFGIPNDYSPRSYLDKTPVAPSRSLNDTFDFVFSRVDAETL
jgi:FkbM family methyltransferase